MEIKLCKCGCNQPVKCKKSNYLSGHINRDPKIQERKRLKCLEIYGVEHPSKLICVKEKSKQTCLSRYGSITNLINIEYKEKNKQIIIDKYGVDNPFKSEKIKKKIKETNIRIYGVENPAQSKEIQEQKKENSILRYGVESPNQLEYVKEKKKLTCLKNYGVETPSQSKVIQKKSEQTQKLIFGDLYCRTLKAKQMYRLNFLKLINDQRLNNEPIVPRIGGYERECLNELQKYTNYIIIRNNQSIGYSIGFFPDGCISELKLLIEFDEEYHNNSNQKIKDIDRELELAALGYMIYRIKKTEWEKDPEMIINQFKSFLDLLKY
jgi:very-short-patch-repair endonuclease